MVHFRFLLVVLTVVSLSTGCTSLMPGAQQPEVRTLTVPDPQGLVYRKALSTAVAMGTTITQANEAAGLIQGTLHNAALLTIEITPGPSQSGSTLTVSARLLPNKIAVGSLTEAEDFLRAYHERGR